MADIRLSAEKKYEQEIGALIQEDSGARPPGWAMTPRSVETYVLGADKPVAGANPRKLLRRQTIPRGQKW